MQAIVAAFTARFLRDRERGEVRPVADYQVGFPGYEQAIAAEYDLLTGGAAAVPPGHRVPDRYEDRGVLGQGGMGEVRRVFDRELRREVARKTLRRDGGAAARPHQVMRFVEEAQIAGQLEHPGIIPVYDLSVDEAGRAYFTMSLVRGREFGEIIGCVHAARDGWTLTRAVDVLLRVCDAVAFAHSKGVAHRDLKPANVLVGEFGRTHVVDWGLARVFEASADGRGVSSMRDSLDEGNGTPAALTLRGDILGTASYMAPELTEGGADRAGFAADAYALGAILYQLLTGRAPYTDRGVESSAEVLELLRQGPPAPVHSLRRDAPPELVAVCEKAMARAPENRYACVGDFADDLRAFLDLRVVRAYGSGPFAELRKWVVRNRALAAACALAVLALLVGLVLTAVQKRRADAAVLRAEASFRTAFDAIEELSNASWFDLVNAEAMGVDRRRMLQRAVAFYRQFIQQRRDDALVQEHLAEAYRRLGILHGVLGQSAEEIEALGNAEQLQRQLVERAPTAVARANHARVITDLGTVAAREGRIEDARRLLGRALGELDEVIATEPDVLEHQRRRAEALAELANAEVNHGDLQRAFEPREKSVSACRHVAQATGDAGDLQLYAEALWNLGATELRAERFDEALSALTAARSNVEEVLRRLPGDRGALDTLAYTVNGLSVVHAHRGEPERAATLANECVDLRRELVRRYQGHAGYHTELAGNLHNLAMTHQRGGRMEDARALFAEARREQEAAVARAPTSAVAQRYLSYHLNSLCQVLLALRRHREAIEAAEALGPMPKGGVPPRMAPTYAARCLALAAEDPALSESERAALLDDYARRSIVLVRGAIEGGADGEVFRAEPFLALRGRPEFDAVVPR